VEGMIAKGNGRVTPLLNVTSIEDS